MLHFKDLNLPFINGFLVIMILIFRNIQISPSISLAFGFRMDEMKPKQYTNLYLSSNYCRYTTLPAFEIATYTSKEANNNPKPTTENSLVATQLLAAHKYYIDGLMESFHQKMNVVRDFEALLLNEISGNGSDGGRRRVHNRRGCPSVF